jgi:LuxR family maltose regulon positive regulatory protein
LINKIGDVSHDIIVVLDDYHLINNETIHNALAYLLEHQTPKLHLVITTREDPPLPLPRWRARGELIELREHDLSFTTIETKALFNDIIELDLTAEQIEALRDKTEGWISGLQLAALSMRGQDDVEHFVRSFAGSNRFILDYLMEEVFHQQSPEVQDFLLKTAVLEQLTAALCDAVVADSETVEPNSQAMLERLEQANLFIVPLDDSRKWFRYHRLFADLLRQRLRLEKEGTADLHYRAAAWHEQHGFLRRAIKHYLAASAWEKAASIIYLQSDELQKHGENITFLRWMQALPDSVIQAHPNLCLEYAWALALSGQPDEADNFLELAEEAFRGNPAQYGKVLSAQIHVARIRQDLPQTITLSHRALSLIPAMAYDPRCALSLNLGMAYWQSGEILEAESAFAEAQEMAQKAQNHHVRLLAIGFQSMVQAAQGRLHRAADLLQTALKWDADSPASALPHLVQGALFYEWNQLDKAGAHLQKAIALAQLSGNSELQSSAYRQWALFKQAMGDHAGASAALALAERAAGENAPRLTHARNLATAVNIALAQNDLETAERRVDQMQTTASDSIFYVPFFLAPARLYLAQGNKADACMHLDNEYVKAQQSDWRYGQIEIRLLQALASVDSNDALRFLAEALTLGEPEGFRRIFLDKGESLIPLLHLAAGKHVLLEFTKSLLAELEAVLPSPTSPTVSTPMNQVTPSLVEAISERETEVLQLLAENYTNQEIAQALYISVNTVKGHLKSIYGKLDVHTRREAVARARMLHLIDPNK